jgi:hypothetical protein
MNGVGFRNGANTVGFAVFESELKKEDEVGVYHLKYLKQAIDSLSSITDCPDAEVIINVPKMEAGPLLTMRIRRDSKMVISVCPIVETSEHHFDDEDEP